MVNPSPQELLNELHSAKDFASVDYHQKVAYWLELLSIALPAVAVAGTNGNVTCQDALQKILNVKR